MRALVLLATILRFSTTASSAFINRKTCQLPTAQPLDGCPPSTLLVGPNQPFTTIQSAILSLPHDTTPQHILMLPGTYTERLNVTRPGPLTLYGQTTAPTSQTANLVRVLWRAATGAAVNSTLDNAHTSTLTVAPTWNASLTGSGPSGSPVPEDTPAGSADFRAYNVDFVNAYRDYVSGPSLAVAVSWANAGFYFCSIGSYQDTVYVGKRGNAYFYKSEIAGQTDFLYGFGTAWIQSSVLRLRGCGGGITAWKGSNTTFANRYGVYTHDSTIQKANTTLNITGQCALGRPWNSLHRSLFANTSMDDSIRPSGYIKWSPSDTRFEANQTLMAEYANYGQGWNETARRQSGVGVVLTEEQAEEYGSMGVWRRCFSTLEKGDSEMAAGLIGHLNCEGLLGGLMM